MYKIALVNVPMANLSLIIPPMRLGTTPPARSELAPAVHA